MQAGVQLHACACSCAYYTYACICQNVKNHVSKFTVEVDKYMCIYRDALYILLCSVCIQYTYIHTYIDIMCYPVVLHPVEVNPVHPPRDRFQGGISFAVSVSSSESPRFDSYQYMSSISKGRLEIEGATTHFKSQTQPTPISSHPALYYYKSKIRLKTSQ